MATPPANPPRKADFEALAMISEKVNSSGGAAFPVDIIVLLGVLLFVEREKKINRTIEQVCQRDIQTVESRPAKK